MGLQFPTRLSLAGRTLDLGASPLIMESSTSPQTAFPTAASTLAFKKPLNTPLSSIERGGLARYRR